MHLVRPSILYPNLAKVGSSKPRRFLSRRQRHRDVAKWSPNGERGEIVLAGRVILQDFTGVPAVVDIAALRNAMVDLGGDQKEVNPLVPVDLVIDHSVQVDVSGRHADASRAKYGNRVSTQQRTL